MDRIEIKRGVENQRNDSTKAKEEKGESSEGASAIDRLSVGIPRQSQFNLGSFEFCGKTIEVPETALAILGENWESTTMLSRIGPDEISHELAQDAGFRQILRNDTAAEYDADNLCCYLEDRCLSGDLFLTPEFRKFEKSWRRDEMNHAFGFAMLESLLFDTSVEEIFGELRTGIPNFKALAQQGFFDDEFATAVVIAYDEIATTRSYAEDYRIRYPKFKNQVLLDWIKNVAGDERRHFSNIVNVIKACHADRIPEIPALLARILRWEKSEHEYGRTFVLDHTGVQFTPGFIEKAAEKLLQQFGFALSDLPNYPLESRRL